MQLHTGPNLTQGSMSLPTISLWFGPKVLWCGWTTVIHQDLRMCVFWLIEFS